jgi:hypothetical protein
MKIQPIINSFLLFVAAFALSAVPSLAANGKKGDTQASRAKISRAQAERTALKEVPNGTVKEGELEKEKGRLIWSFDIATPGTKNITEVQVDAMDGKVVSKATETPAEESRESAKEKKPQSGGAGSSESD